MKVIPFWYLTRTTKPLHGRIRLLINAKKDFIYYNGLYDFILIYIYISTLTVDCIHFKDSLAYSFCSNVKNIRYSFRPV